MIACSPGFKPATGTPGGAIAVRDAGYAEYDALSHFHYRPGRPATISRVLAAWEDATLVGVLVESFPTINAWWREAAWPGLFRGATAPGPRARVLNREVRTISRVIVEPRWRGLGVGARLVRAALALRMTPRVEAVASMGRFCPLFERAGMRPIPPRSCPRGDALRSTLSREGLEAWMLVDVGRARHELRRSRVVREALARWAGAARGTRRREIGPELLVLACASIVCPARVYVNP